MSSSNEKCNIIWPIGEAQYESNRNTILLNGRYGCDFQLT